MPHLNPDGEARNRPWVERFDADDPAATLGHFLRGRRREAPGRDLEFGYPDLRPENRAATDFLFGGPPVALHASLHGMAVSEGALLLVERQWLGTDRDASLRAAFAEAAREARLPLYDHDRGGDKGFRYGGPGFWSTPEGAAMRQHFLDAGDPETAGRFRRSSMEQALATAPASASPLCVVTFRDEMPALVERAAEADDLGDVVERYGVTCPDLPTQVRLHLRALDAALATA